MVLSEYKQTHKTFGTITKNGLTQGYNIFIFEPSDQAKTPFAKEKTNMSREIIKQELAKIHAPFFDLNQYTDLKFIGNLLPRQTPFFRVMEIYESIDKNQIADIKARMDNLEPHLAQLRVSISGLIEPILNLASFEWNTQEPQQ